MTHGTTLTGDISDRGLSWPVAERLPGRFVIFYELRGLSEERAYESYMALVRWLRRAPQIPTARIRPGVSPHAPYSVRDGNFFAAGFVARQHLTPMAVHLAETREEIELLRRKRGPFVDFLQDLGVWEPDAIPKSIRNVLWQSADVPRLLLVHANYLDPEQPLPRGTIIVYCPRTHAAFGHSPHPFRSFLKRGVRVALGTDSLASNPDLDLLAEARFVRERYPDVTCETIVRMATLWGAEALGWADETGSLSLGKSADLVVLPAPKAEPADPHDLFLRSTERVQAVLFRGKWVYDSRKAAKSRRARPPTP